MNRWFTSDHHLWHDNIIRYADRPFENVREMNEALLTWYNEWVKPEDHVYWLGDITMRRGGWAENEIRTEVRKYNGHKRLFLGNHDHCGVDFYRSCGFEKIFATHRDEQRIIYSHYPLHPGSIGTTLANVHGHIHQNKSPDPMMWLNQKTQKIVVVPYINVCVEVTNYRPIHFDELMSRIKQVKGDWEGGVQEASEV